jgi:predicted dehydrogenase
MRDVFELVAICDADAAHAENVAGRHSVRAYGSVRELVRRETLDAAAISTPGDSHHAIGAFLAEHGVHLIVETPIATTLRLADVLLEAVRRNGVRLEVAENYPREPRHLFKRDLIASGAIGGVLRVISLFQTGGYHIISSVRMLAGSDALRATSIRQRRDIPRVNVSDTRQYTSEDWTMGVVDFRNGAIGLTAYSEIVHGRALGRKEKPLQEVDGTTGSIVEDTVFLTTEEQRLNGGRAAGAPIRARWRDTDQGRVLERLELEGDVSYTWDNPFPQYAVGEGSLAIIEEMDSLARAVRDGVPTRYTGEMGRHDQEISFAIEESGRRDRAPVALPLDFETADEAAVHDRLHRQHGVDPTDWDRMVDCFFPRV